MKIWLFVLVLIGLYFAGIGVEYYGRTCPECIERRKKWFGGMYSSDNPSYTK